MSWEVVGFATFNNAEPNGAHTLAYYDNLDNWDFTLDNNGDDYNTPAQAGQQVVTTNSDTQPNYGSTVIET